MSWPWSLWKRQYFFGFLCFEDELNNLGHFKVGSSFIYMRNLSTSISKEVKFKFFFDGTSRLLLPALGSEGLALWSLFLLYDSTLFSFFRLPINPFAVSESSPFIYFCALNIKFVIKVGGVFTREKTRSRLFNPTWKVIITTWSSVSSISNTALLKHFTYSLKVSPSCCFTASRYEVGLLWHWPPMKCQTKEFLNYSKFAIDTVGNLLNHTHAAPLRVVRQKSVNYLVWGLLEV